MVAGQLSRLACMFSVESFNDWQFIAVMSGPVRRERSGKRTPVRLLRLIAMDLARHEFVSVSVFGQPASQPE